MRGRNKEAKCVGFMKRPLFWLVVDEDRLSLIFLFQFGMKKIQSSVKFE